MLGVHSSLRVKNQSPSPLVYSKDGVRAKTGLDGGGYGSAGVPLSPGGHLPQLLPHIVALCMVRRCKCDWAAALALPFPGRLSPCSSFNNYA